MKTLSTAILLALLLLSQCAYSHNHVGIAQHKDVQKFIDMMVEKHHFNRSKLNSIFASTHKKNIIIKKIRNRKIWLLLWYKSSPPSVEYIEKLLIIPNVIIQNNKTKSNDLNF